MRWILIIITLLLSSSLSAQNLQWSGSILPGEASNSFRLQLPEHPSAPTQHLSLFQTRQFGETLLQASEHFIPTFARQNPSGYSYLCRLELKAENTMAIPLWFRAENGREGAMFPGGNVYLQIKALRF